MARHTILIICLAAISVLTGCQGGGQVQLIPHRTRDIPESKPLIWTARVDECLWWRDELGSVHISMGFERGGLFVPEANRLRFAMAMDLGEPPAGRARNYQIRSKMVNAEAGNGLETSYLTSLYGIVAVWNQRGRQLKGRCQVSMLQRQSNPLFGLGRPGQTLLLSDFVAVYDEARGKALRDTATAHLNAGESASQPTSQPAPQPTSPPTRSCGS